MVLISRVSVLGTTVGGRSGSVCAEVLKWVVGDLSAASAVVLISPTVPQALSAVSYRGTHFLRFSMMATQVDYSYLFA